MKFQGIIFDLDGVICSTDEYHYQAWKALADRLGIPFDRERNNLLRGVSRMASLEIILEKSDRTYTDAEKAAFAEEKNTLYRQLLHNMSPSDLSDEVRETLNELRERGITLAIGSSSKNTPFILERIGLGSFFDAVADGNCITHSKPDPEVFLKAAEFIHLDPSVCLVVEDAHAGVQAAKAGGFACAAMGDAKDDPKADFHLNSFGNLLKVTEEKASETIDANVYWFPEAMFTDDALRARFFMDVPRAYNTGIKMVERNGKKQIIVERPIGCAGVDYIEGDYQLAAMLSAMDKAGIDKAVMKVPCVHEWMSLDMCRYFNDGMADYARRSNGRLTALAVIPPWGAPEQLQELDRCVNELGMKGIQLCAHYGEYYLDADVFAPLFEKLNAYGMTVYVHHTPVPVEYRSIAEYNNLRRSLGRCEDQLTAVGRELFSGMFEKYPNVRLVHSMLGGGFFTYKEMLMPHGPAGNDGRFAATPESMQKHLANNLYFEMSHAQPWGKVLLETAVKILGADHIIYGSSYPVKADVWMAGGAEYVKSLDISEEEKNLILCQNAKMLYKIND